jgi:hypothetical protein
MLSFLFMKVGCLCLAFRTLKWVQKDRWQMRGLNWARKCWYARGMMWAQKCWTPKGIFYPSYAGTLARVKSLATMFESVVPPYPNVSGSFLFFC